MSDAEQPQEPKTFNRRAVYAIAAPLLVAAVGVGNLAEFGTVMAADRTERACVSVTVSDAERADILSAAMTQSLCDRGEAEHEGFECTDGAFLSYDLTDNKGSPARPQVDAVAAVAYQPYVPPRDALPDSAENPGGVEAQDEIQEVKAVSAVDYRPAVPAGPSTTTVELCTQREFTDTPRQR